ncbi:hypothetical protein GCM10011329_19970 [Stakelama pacifica]|nr:hypothetical protein GCM10011329_19970 [Stakelama pacifica]
MVIIGHIEALVAIVAERLDMRPYYSRQSTFRSALETARPNPTTAGSLMDGLTPDYKMRSD